MISTNDKTPQIIINVTTKTNHNPNQTNLLSNKITITITIITSDNKITIHHQSSHPHKNMMIL